MAAGLLEDDDQGLAGRGNGNFGWKADIALDMLWPMSGYSDPDRHPSMKAERRQTIGVRAASYGIGFLIYGIIGLASGELLGFGTVPFLHDHSTSLSIDIIILGLMMLVFGWRRPE